MYYPIGWPKHLRIPQDEQRCVRHVICHRDKILFAVITADSIGIWFCKPCVQILNHRRSAQSVDLLGENRFAEWRFDSTSLAVVTCKDNIIFYSLDIDSSRSKFVYEQRDSKIHSLQRETAELFIKESIRPVLLTESFTVSITGGIVHLSSVRDELVLSTRNGFLERLRWDGSLDLNYSINITSIPFSTDQQHSRAYPIDEAGIYIVSLEFSPILGGFSIVLSDGRAAFLTAASLKFEQNQVQGIWAPDLHNACCTCVNHKYKLMAFGRKNSRVTVCCTDDLTGELQVSQTLELSSKDCDALGIVSLMKWTPDSCALAVAWEHGGLSLWSVFGALLMSTLGWDSGMSKHINNNYCVQTMEWGSEGYNLWIGTRNSQPESSLLQMNFIKSALTVNPSMSNQEQVFLQGEDRLYINAGDAVIKVFRQQVDCVSDDEIVHTSSSLVGNKQWIVIPIPYTYTGSNWPLRYAAIDQYGECLAIAGKAGLAHYDVVARKWKLFGNETQEKDFVVTGGLLWWRNCIIMGCYNFLDDKDEIRLYPRVSKLDNNFACVASLPAQVLALNQFRDKLIAFCANNRISLFTLDRNEPNVIQINRIQDIDISNLGFHPACVTSVALTSLRTETVRQSNKDAESILINVCGKLILIQRDMNYPEDTNESSPLVRFCSPTMLASCVENVWVSSISNREKQHLVDALWLGCGAHGLKVWLPLLPRENEKSHNFMSRRIMLPFHVHIYPLAVLFEDAVILGAENDSVLFASDPNNLRSTMPFNVVERTSQVYLHHILRQLLRRNLGFHAWEIARSCVSLPYFSHSLELLLHEVLEEEATSKEPIPDALLPRVIEFIREFPVYLQTVVQCARKTEIALWRHLFTAVGDPKDLFQQCLNKQQLTTAASYLIILQNLETPSVSRQHATILLDAALDNNKWELAKDLVRFLRAIDPSDVETPPRSINVGSAPKYSMTSPSDEDLSFVLGSLQVPRGRTMSVTSTVKVSESESTSSKPIPIKRKSFSKDSTAEEFFIDVILQRHTRKLLSTCRLRDLGRLAAHLDIHLVSWLKKERARAARVEDFVSTLKKLHLDFSWPLPVATSTNNYDLSSSVDEVTKDLERCPGSSSPTLIGDSGYLSTNAELTCHLSVTSFDNVAFNNNNNQTLEAQLRPRLVVDEDTGSLDTVEMSEESSVWGEGETLPFLDQGTWAGNGEQVELVNKGPHESEVQLRYLLQLMMEAGCLDYSLLISIVLRDAMAVIRTVNASRVYDQGREIPIRLKEGIVAMEQWSNRQCLGYKSFMQIIRGQLPILNKIIWSKPRSSICSVSESVSSVTTNEDQLSPSPSQLNNLTDRDAKPEENDDDSSCKNDIQEDIVSAEHAVPISVLPVSTSRSSECSIS